MVTSQGRASPTVPKCLQELVVAAIEEAESARQLLHKITAQGSSSGPEGPGGRPAGVSELSGLGWWQPAASLAWPLLLLWSSDCPAGQLYNLEVH